MDICGPVGVKTLAGSEYFILFKDEFSTYRFIYFLKTKGEAFDCLEKCFNQIYADTEHKILKIMSDRGSGFMSGRSQALLQSKGIVHEVSAPFTPEQNGLIERENRTVMKAARSMLFHRKLPEKLWGEAAMTAVYILNRTINRITGLKTPYELYFQEKPHVGHIRVFGSLVLYKAQEKKRSGYQKKLDPRAVKGVLIGYERDYTYRAFDPATNKVIVTREAKVDESRTIDEIKSTPTCYDHLEVWLEPLSITMNDEVVAQCDPSGSGASEGREQQKADTDDIEIDEAPVPPVRTSSIKPPAPLYNLRSRVQAEPEEEFSDALLTGGEEPSCYQEAISSNDKKLWKEAMDAEFNSLKNNNTWRLCSLPEG